MADIGYDLLPADDLTLTADEALESALSAPDLEADPEPLPLGRGWDFDFETGQMRRHGEAPAVVSDIANLRVWIAKALATHRFAHPIYSGRFGTDFPGHLLIGHPFSPEVAGEYTEALKAAVLAHDRIEQVTDITYSGDLASALLEVSFTVVLDDEDAVRVENVPVGVGV